MGEDSMDEDQDLQQTVENENNDNDQDERRTVTLSKSWSISSAHVPTFTGGKVTHFYTGTTLSSSKANEQNDDNSIVKDHINQFLLLPVNGDVAIVDAKRGVKLGTIRGEDTFLDDEEDDGLDQEAITAYALARKDQIVMACSQNQILRQYGVNASQGGNPVKLTKTWGRSGHTLPVTLMEFHSSSVFLATGSIDGTVRIWDVRGAYVTHVFRPFAGGDGGGSGRLSVTSLSWRADTSQLILAIARDDGSIVVHDLRDADRVVILRDHVSAVTSMKWWGHEFFVSTGRDAILNLWRIVISTSQDELLYGNKKSKKKQKKQSKQLKNNTKVIYRRIQTLPIYEQVEGIAIISSANHNELVVATAGSKGIVRLWKAVVTVGETPELKLVRQQPSNQAFQEQRGGYMGLVGIQDYANSQEGDIPNDELLIAVDAEHNLSFLQDDLSLGRTIVGHNDEILDLKVIPSSGRTPRVVVATNCPQIRIFELDNFSCAVLDGHSATVLCVEVSPCGRYIASCGKDKTMRIWRISDDNHDRPICVATATGHTEAIGACGLSRKIGRYDVGGKAAKNGGGAFAVTASLDRTLKRWNLPGPDDIVIDRDSNQNPYELTAFVSVRGHEKDINIVSVAPNDSLVATGSQDKTVKLWRSTDLVLQTTLKGHKRGVWDCQFSPIDRVLATSSGDKTIKLWSLGDYSCVRTFQGHVASVLRVRFLTGGLQLMSAGADGLIKLWTIRTNECEATLDGHNDRVWALDLKTNAVADEDRVTLVSGGADSKLVVWEDQTQEVEEEKRAKEAEAILLDQKLANYLRFKEFDKALEIALQVDKPMQALKVMTSIVEHDLQTKRQNGLASLQRHVQVWTMERITQVLKYCREWNTRARNCHIAMLVVKAIVTTVPADELATTNGIPEILAGIVPYAERHSDRLDKLCTSSYLLDYSLVSVLGGLHPLEEVSKNEKDFELWQATSKLVLPPKELDGRIQKGGKAIVGGKTNMSHRRDGFDFDSDEDDDVVTIGDSTTSEESIGGNSEDSEQDAKPTGDDDLNTSSDETTGSSGSGNAKGGMSASSDEDSSSDSSSSSD